MLHELESTPNISRKQEQDLLRKVQQLSAGTELREQQSALEALIKSHLKIVLSLLTRHPYLARAADRAELIQQALLEMVELARTVDPEGQWSYGVEVSNRIPRSLMKAAIRQKTPVSLTNHAINTYLSGRKENKNTQVDQFMNPVQVLDSDTVESDPQETLIAQERSRLLREALLELTAEERRMITAAFGLDGGQAKTNRQVAAEMGITYNRACYLRSRVVEKLRRNETIAKLAL